MSRSFKMSKLKSEKIKKDEKIIFETKYFSLSNFVSITQMHFFLCNCIFRKRVIIHNGDKANLRWRILSFYIHGSTA